MIDLARPRLADLPVQLVNAGFEELRQVLDELRIDRVDAILADLGFCSDQVDDPSRGFRFQVSGPLDMRLDPNRGQPAARLLATLPERELADLIYRYGEERHSRRIARKIVERRNVEPLTTTDQLADVVRSCVPRGHGKIDPATRTFQALRIAVNDEIAALEALLKQLPNCLKQGGRAALISFHSLEDRLVKQAFRQSDIWEPLTKKPITPSAEEVSNNPRSRSAKLRAAQLKTHGGDT
jgi:16S rRNA (cytosine1402-N4)-methyltransferase